ncbi:uncharacterized protein LOC141882091 [Acropora palmata]|uniref:uncharacterized protein LOC141882091 n=1 Tax=Acropora palmata TaxID=6131 RepID=UPI003DA107A6
MNDPLRVSREGPFWASMFIVLGVVVGFGGTMEKFMLGYATEKLRTRLHKMAFDTTVNKNSVPHIPGATGGFSFPGTGGQLPGIPGISGVIQPPEITGIPTEIKSPDGLLPAITEITTGIKSPDGELDVFKSAEGLPGIPGKPTGITLNIPSSQELTKASTGASSLPSLPGMTEGIPGSRFLRSVDGGISEAMISGSGVGGVAAMVAGIGAISTTDEHQQEQSLPGSTLVPTGANDQLDCTLPIGVTQGIGVPQQQEMSLPLNLPNSDLSVLPDPQKQADQLVLQIEKDVEAALDNVTTFESFPDISI